MEWRTDDLRAKEVRSDGTQHFHSLSRMVMHTVAVFPKSEVEGKARMLHPDKSHISGNDGTSPWLKSHLNSKRIQF